MPTICRNLPLLVRQCCADAEQIVEICPASYTLHVSDFAFLPDHHHRCVLSRTAPSLCSTSSVHIFTLPPLVKELPPAEPSSYSNPHILPPAYSLHTAAPISSNRLITDYKSSIAPSSSYLSDPLNAYAHLGMPKPFVHLFGPPLDLALDSGLAGNHGRFARSGCRPMLYSVLYYVMIPIV